MYDRYQSRRKSNFLFKLVAILVVAGAVLFIAIKYQRHLAFWRYNQNKLYGRVDAARRIKDADRKKEVLSDLAETFTHYTDERMVDPEAFVISGEVRYLLGLTYLPGNFSELFINDLISEIGREAKAHFTGAIRDFKKGAALDGEALDESALFMLAKSAYYAGHYTPEEIFPIIEKAGRFKKGKDVENVRFYSVMHILNGREDFGLKFLSENGMIKDNIQGLLFYATAERIANKYTGAIMSYRDVLSRTSDDRIRELVHVNLGRIYFNQSLYRESIEQFTLALKLNERGSSSRIWIGKSYFAMGEKDKAKAIWSEVLSGDGTNEEARKLLETM